MYIYIRAESSAYPRQTNMTPMGLSQIPRPIPNANVLAVKLPNAMGYATMLCPSQVRLYHANSHMDALSLASLFTRRPLICCSPFAVSLIALSKGCWLS